MNAGQTFSSPADMIVEENQEFWVPLPDRRYGYEISSHYRVRNTRTGKILTPSPKGQVKLCREGVKPKPFYVRKLHDASFGRPYGRRRPNYLQSRPEREWSLPNKRFKVSDKCTAGHPLSMTAEPDANTAIWGRGNRICVTCRDAIKPFPHQANQPDWYSRHYGVTRIPESKDRSTETKHE